MSLKFLQRSDFWIITLGLAVMVSWPLVQIARYKRAFEPFSPIGAWLYSGGDDMGVPFNGPEGVREVFFNDETIGDAELSGVMVHLKRFPRLEALHMDRTRITDAVLPQLAELKLRRIYIQGTAITAEGVRDFRRRAPACVVSWQPPEPAVRQRRTQTRQAQSK